MACAGRQGDYCQCFAWIGTGGGSVQAADTDEHTFFGMLINLDFRTRNWSSSWWAMAEVLRQLEPFE